MADMWSEWNLKYWNADFPRLLVRFEDLLFHTEAVVRNIRKCLNGYSKPSGSPPPFQYVLEAAKDHGFSADYVTAMQRYGTRLYRHKGMTRADKIYANQALSEVLMKTFHYPPVPVWHENVRGP